MHAMRKLKEFGCGRGWARCAPCKAEEQGFGGGNGDPGGDAVLSSEMTRNLTHLFATSGF